MLPATHRLRPSAEFATVTRAGRRNRGTDVVVYLADAATGPDLRIVSDQTCSESPPTRLASGQPARAGLIVSRQVGGSVVRHRVSRRLRAQLASRLGSLPAGCRVVVRALPSAAEASSDALGRQLDAAFGKLVPAQSAAASPRATRSSSAQASGSTKVDR